VPENSRLINAAKKLQEFLVPVALVKVGDHFTLDEIQGGE